VEQWNIPYLPQNRCVFIKCLRAKRVLFWATPSFYQVSIRPLLSCLLSFLSVSSPLLSVSSPLLAASSPLLSVSSAVLSVSSPILCVSSALLFVLDHLLSSRLPPPRPRNLSLVADFSHDEASHDAPYEASFHASAASFPYDPNSRRGSVMQRTGVLDDPKVGYLLARGDKKEV
jgi:hypothetical protein